MKPLIQPPDLSLNRGFSISMGIWDNLVMAPGTLGLYNWAAKGPLIWYNRWLIYVWVKYGKIKWEIPSMSWSLTHKTRPAGLAVVLLAKSRCCIVGLGHVLDLVQIPWICLLHRLSVQWCLTGCGRRPDSSVGSYFGVVVMWQSLHLRILFLLWNLGP